MTVSKTTKEVDEKDIDFDDLLPYAGEFGPYQVFLFMSTLPFYFYFAFVSYGQIFLTEAPQEHWCWIPELENLTALERLVMFLFYTGCCKNIIVNRKGVPQLVIVYNFSSATFCKFVKNGFNSEN